MNDFFYLGVITKTFGYKGHSCAGKTLFAIEK